MFKSVSRLSVALNLLLATAVCFTFASCGKGGDSGDTSAGGKIVLQNAGSDTMVNLAQAWAEEYAAVDQGVSIEVSGGGSGTGIAALINGTVDIANCSRAMKPAEVERAKQNTGKDPKEFIVGYDALAVYVHTENPLNEVTIEQLGNIYGEGGNLTTWSQFGISHSSCSGDEIIRVSRQSNSGTYHYFREALLGKTRDFKLGSRDLHGSKDVVELVEKTPCAIGYSGMGYATDHVKMLKVARKAGETAYAPTLESALAGTYPIARPLYMYSLGEPSGAAKQYLDWIFSEEGQKIVEQSGYVPLKKQPDMTADK
ncbi:phosphate ABC transporter substrate-binding protein [bacterium]|nr:phosphate ABC transporter substrate-binding protein [bacterium]